MGCGSSVTVAESNKKTKNSRLKPDKLPPIKRSVEFDEDQKTKRTENLEPFRIVCLNNSFDEDDKQIRSIVDFLVYFDDRLKCEDYLIDQQHKDFIFFIVSIKDAEQIIGHVHNSTRIHSIYVLNDDSFHRTNQQQIKKKYPKVKDVYDTQITLLEQLSLDVENLLMIGDLMPLTIYSRPEAVQLTSNSTDHLRFLFYQLFIHEFCLDSSTRFNRDELIETLTEYYSSNRHMIKKIKRFDDNYDSPTDILDCLSPKHFLNRILTESLVQLNIPVLFSMKFLIADVHRSMINNENFHSKPNYSYSGTSRFSYGKSSREQVFYRAQALSKDRLAKIKSNSGELLSMNNFMFASRNRQSSVKFLRENVVLIDSMQRVLFEIKVPENFSMKKRRPFIDYNLKIESNRNADDEDEDLHSVLFFIGSIFRIQSVVYDVNNELSTIQLVLYDEEMNEDFSQMFTFLFNQQRSEYESIKTLANLLRQISPKSAEQFYHHLLTGNRNPSSKIECYRGLGICSYSQNNFEQALKYFQNALNLRPKEDSIKSSLFHSVGLVYAQQNKIDDALEQFNRALETSTLPSHRACVHHNIALIHGQKGQHKRELEHYEEALQIRQRQHPSHQAQIASLHNNIGITYLDLHQYDQAETSLRTALDLRLKAFHENHIEVARSYANIGTVRTKTRELESAEQYFKKALDIFQKQKDPPEEDIKQLKSNIKILNDTLRRKTF